MGKDEHKNHLVDDDSDSDDSDTSNDDSSDDDDDDDADDMGSSAASAASNLQAEVEAVNQQVVAVSLTDYTTRKDNVTAYPYNYEAQREWLEAIRAQHGRHTSYMREARLNMAAIFSLPLAIWRLWLLDEIQLRRIVAEKAQPHVKGNDAVATPLSIDELCELYNKATADYHCTRHGDAHHQHQQLQAASTALQRESLIDARIIAHDTQSLETLRMASHLMGLIEFVCIGSVQQVWICGWTTLMR